MTNRERVMKVFRGEKPDRIPFMPFTELIPRGAFEKEMRNRGMGLMTTQVNSLYSEMPHVETQITNRDGYKVTTYHTPVGDVSTRHKTHEGSLNTDATVQQGFLIKDIADYKPVIFMIEDTVYYKDGEEFQKVDLALGEDGMLHNWTDEPPFMDAQYYMGLERWSYEQYDHPEEFQALLEALDRRQERRLRLLLDSPEYLINLGNLAGNFGPEQYKKYMLPYFKKYVPMFRERGKITTLHADALNLNEFKDLVMEHGVDVIEAFTPPPVGNLSLAEARKAWGEDAIIHVNFPEAVFYEGYEETKKYTLGLLESDPSYKKILGFTEMGLMAMDAGNMKMFKDGVTAIMDAIDEYGDY